MTRWLSERAPVQWLMNNRYDSLTKICRYQGPVLMSHGTADSLVPYELGCKLFGRPERPSFCIGLQPSAEMCCDSREQAIAWLTSLEYATRPTPV